MKCNMFIVYACVFAQDTNKRIILLYIILLTVLWTIYKISTLQKKRERDRRGNCLNY